MASTETIQKQMSLLPEYQEKYLKDLLANIYQVDEESGTITGIAAQNPLYGQPVMQDGVQMYQGLDGDYVTDASMAATDQYGEPILAVEGGVAVPDVIGFTDPQTEAIARLTGGVDPVTGAQYKSMIGAYQPYIDDSLSAFESGVSSLEGSMGAYDPQGQIQYDTMTNADGTTSQVPRLDAEGNPVRSGGYQDFYDPFVEDVIDATYADIDRAGAIEGIGARAEAIGAGAYGGSRQGVAESELQRNILDLKAKTGSQLRSAAYTGAQQQAQSAFENQQKRGQNAGQLFQGLGTGIGALGEAQQALGFQGVNTLFNTGALEQNQLQAEYDVQRAGQLEDAYEPFARFSYMRDILQGIPSSGTALAAAATPQASFMGGALSRANSIYGGQGGPNPILGGLGALKNVSGA
jgi:hypothetical protein